MNTVKFSLPVLHLVVRKLIDLIGRNPRMLRPGVTITPLISLGDRVKLARLDYAPGATVPRHRHPQAEIIYMLAGEQSDDRGTYGAGVCVINRAGSEHAIVSRNGCTLMIYWREPVQFISDSL